MFSLVFKLYWNLNFCLLRALYQDSCNLRTIMELTPCLSEYCAGTYSILVCMGSLTALISAVSELLLGCVKKHDYHLSHVVCALSHPLPGGELCVWWIVLFFIYVLSILCPC